jgi:transglutaminase-like putative cysteine protease
MGIKVALEHRTSYTFDRLVEVHPHVVRLRPAPHSRTPIEAYSLQVEPADHFVNWQQDAFGNFLARLVFPDRARSLSALHPTITVDRPLRFELLDMARGTSRGGCTYHVSHYGGRSYETPPVNAVEAESRRGRRFEATGFTPGRVDTSDIGEKQARQSTDVGAPGILDLRRMRTVLH